MRAAVGVRGARWIAFGIAISTLGFLSQGILTAPRVYYAMARDGLFFKSVGWLAPRTGVPVVAIVLQGVTATVIARRHLGVLSVAQNHPVAAPREDPAGARTRQPEFGVQLEILISLRSGSGPTRSRRGRPGSGATGS